jgi:hypothetical protein
MHGGRIEEPSKGRAEARTAGAEHTYNLAKQETEVGLWSKVGFAPKKHKTLSEI